MRKLNKCNADFWARESEHFSKQVEKRPQEIAAAIEIVSKQQLHMLADGIDPVQATRMLQNIEEVAAVFRQSNSAGQKSRAKKARPDRLQILILKIMREHPQIKGAELTKALEANRFAAEEERVIEEVTETAIYWIDGRGKGGNAAKLTGLKDRMSRARQTLLSR